jgi:hypothetical protein
MAPKRNPLKLNKLQLKTLTLLQELATLPDFSRKNEENGDMMITALPNPHGDHFHLGEGVVMASDATGLRNEAVWLALARKGLVSANYREDRSLTPAGFDYHTGMRDKIFR